MSMTYTFFHTLFVILYRILFRYVVIGKENIPSDGAVLLCSNHISLLDPPFVGIHTKRRVAFMAKKELFSIPILGYILRKVHAFPVNRGATDKRAMRTSMTILKEGNVLMMFPEGTRSQGPKLGKSFSGAGLIALKVNCTVIPVSIVGSYQLFRKMKIVYGQPIDLSDLRVDKITKVEAEEATNRVMGAVQETLDCYSKTESQVNK